MTATYRYVGQEGWLRVETSGGAETFQGNVHLCEETIADRCDPLLILWVEMV